MSRGLGARQRLILQAIRHLEQEEPTPGGEFMVWAVLKAAWDIGLKDEREGIEQHERRRFQDMLARTELQAVAGDANAQQYLAIRRSVARAAMGLKPRSRRFGLRGFAFSAEKINPSRTLALLHKRGLVERGHTHGSKSAPGAWVRLTDKGRVEAD